METTPNAGAASASAASPAGPKTRLAVGARLANRFTIVEFVNHGLFAEMYRATDSSDDRTVIIKLLHRRSNPDVSYEEMKPLIFEDLKRSRLEQLTQQSDLELRKSARITEP